jgi:hypothetical protein
MCRLAARSDDSEAVALAERIAMIHLAEHQDAPAGRAAERLQHQPRRRFYRATG